MAEEPVREHDCEAWIDEGRGCAICSGILKGLRGDDLANAAARMSWMNSDCLALLDAAFRERAPRMPSGPKKGWWSPTDDDLSDHIASMLVAAGQWVEHDEGGFYRPVYEEGGA